MLQLFHVNRWVGNWNVVPATQQKTWPIQRSKYGSFMVRSLDVWCTDAAVTWYKPAALETPLTALDRNQNGTQFSSLNKEEMMGTQKNYA